METLHGERDRLRPRALPAPQDKGRAPHPTKGGCGRSRSPAAPPLARRLPSTTEHGQDGVGAQLSALPRPLHTAK